MATDPAPSDTAALEADVIHQQLGALNDASRQRHRLVPGSPEYEAALEIEERIAEHVWEVRGSSARHAAAQRAGSWSSRPDGRYATGSPASP